MWFRCGSQESFSRFYLAVCAAALAAVAGLQYTLPAQTSGPMPDLTIDAARLQASLVVKTQSFKATDCASVEGCIAGTGKRKLLKFDVAIVNNGDGDMVLGNPVGSPAYEYSPCHGHYHLKGFAYYELTNGTTKVVGNKLAFCLRDTNQVAPTAGPAKFTCENQGITVGWSDVYGSSLDCQWLDITGVPAGNYTLTVIVNYESNLIESSYTNNTATVPVKIKK